MLFLECETFFFGTANKIPSQSKPSPHPELELEGEGEEVGDAVANAGVSVDDVGALNEEEKLEGVRMVGKRKRRRAKEPSRSVSWSRVAAALVDVVGSMACDISPLCCVWEGVGKVRWDAQG